MTGRRSKSGPSKVEILDALIEQARRKQPLTGAASVLGDTAANPEPIRAHGDPRPRPNAQAVPRARRQRVQSAGIGMAVLKGLARLDGSATLSALASEIDQDPPKVHRYLVSLIEEGLVAQDRASQRYYLGPEAIHIGLVAMRQSDPIRMAEPGLVRLRENLGVTCFLAIMGNKGPTIMRFEEPSLPVTINVRAGSVLSMLWSATGRVFLGLRNDVGTRQMAEAELAAATPEQRARLDKDDPIGALQREVRVAGCANVMDVYLRGISAVAAPVYDYHSRVCAVITALGASGGFDASLDGEIANSVRSAAWAASTALASPTVPKLAF